MLLPAYREARKSGYPGLMLYAVLGRAAGHGVRPGTAQ
jgi:hypothetical protein